MAITHTTAVRNALANLIDDQVNAGTTNAGGRIVFQTSGDVEVATCQLSATAFGAASSGVITANTITDDTNATGGTVAKFIITDRDNTTVLSGTVTATSGGGDIELSSTTIGAGDTVSVTSLTYTASA